MLIKLTDKIEALRTKLIEDAKPSAPDDASGAEGSSLSSVKAPGAAAESPSNIKLIDTTIRSDVQRKLYLQFMSDSKAESKGLKFDLTRALEPSEESQGDDLDQGPGLLAQPPAMPRQGMEQAKQPPTLHLEAPGGDPPIAEEAGEDAG